MIKSYILGYHRHKIRDTNLQNIQLVLFLFHITVVFFHPIFNFFFQYLQERGNKIKKHLPFDLLLVEAKLVKPK